MLPHTCSDHSAILISGAGTLSLGPRPFKFHSVWLEHSSFEDIVLSFWNDSHFYGCPMFVLTSELKALKSCLKSWNLQVFGNVHANIVEARNKLSVIQSAISSSSGSEELFQEESITKQHLLDAVPSKKKWLSDGDSCSKLSSKLPSQ